MLSFQWTQTGGTVVALDDATSATATFTAPDLLPDTTPELVLIFQLAVTDLTGNSDTDEVEVTVPSGGDPI